MIDWTKHWPTAKAILASAPRHSQIVDCLPDISGAIGSNVNADMLKHAAKLHEGVSARAILGTAVSVSEGANVGATVRGVRGDVDVASVGAVAHAEQLTPEDNSIDALVRLAKRGIGFDDLCDKLDMSPKRVRRLVDIAKEQGYRVDVAGDNVAWREPELGPDHGYDTDVGVAPTVGGRSIVAVVSDTHFGSKYCMRDAMCEFVRHAYEQGARHVLHSGDMLDGCYKHGQWELSHHGVDDQIDDALATLPRLDGLSYHYITGNHDETFTDSTGLDTGRLIADRARSIGRTDLHYYGCRGARLRLGNVRVELWHPRKGNAYALSYQLQNHIRDYPVGVKPDILIAGHWHRAIYFEQRGVHAVSAPCWQSGLSSFGKSLGGAPSIGGWLLSWETTHHGTLRRFSAERSAYYDQEGFRDLDDEVQA